MSANISLMERNDTGIGDPSVTRGIYWKAQDNSNPYYVAGEAILAGQSSYEKWNYIMFTGYFTSITNVSITNTSGILNNGVKLYSSGSASSAGDCLTYQTPTNLISEVAVNNFSNQGSTISLLLGPPLTIDPAEGTGKTSTSFKSDYEALFTNYIVTQLQTSQAAQSGDINPINLQISYDEN